MKQRLAWNRGIPTASSVCHKTLTTKSTGFANTHPHQHVALIRTEDPRCLEWAFSRFKTPLRNLVHYLILKWSSSECFVFSNMLLQIKWTFVNSSVTILANASESLECFVFVSRDCTHIGATHDASHAVEQHREHCRCVHKHRQILWRVIQAEMCCTRDRINQSVEKFPP